MHFLIHQCIDDWAQRQPDAPAIGFLDESLTYAQLATASTALATQLLELGVKSHDRIGIYMDKRLQTPIAMYGIMKAGAAYVPLDPSAPVERIAFVLNDCGIRHLITENSKLKKIGAITAQYDGLESLLGISRETNLPLKSVSWQQIESNTLKVSSRKIISDDLAYIIYTSGSTGTPKGIMHTHSSGLAFAFWATREYGLQANDRLSNHAPLHFDLSIFDYFAAAVAGACVVIIPDDYTKLPPSYSKLIADQKITVLFTVPFALIQLLFNGVLEQRDLSELRWIIFGGEPFPVKHLRALMAHLPDARFDNMYGPAEVNGVTHFTVESIPDDAASIPIGGMSNIADALVLDKNNLPVAMGDPGELLVRSPTMMHGYWGQPELTAKSMFRQSLFDCFDTVYYRTGDLVVENDDGIYEFLGRKDRQIKIRGYRVELDEVETALVSHPQVKEGVAFAVPTAQGSQQIQVAVIAKQGEQLSVENLTAFLKTRLPWYAVPSEQEVCLQFPRTTTGKIDRRCLRQQAIDSHQFNEDTKI